MKKILVVLLVLTWSSVLAQTPLNVIVDGLYFDNLGGVLDRISQKYSVSFICDKELCKLVQVEERPTQQTLGELLDNICKANKLKYFVDNDKKVHIIPRWENQNFKMLSRTRDYWGKPKRFNITLSGKIIDQTTQETLPFVNISVKGTSIGSASNVDGYFTLLNVPCDTVTLVCSYIGYEKQILYLSPYSSINNILIELNPETQEISEVVITGEKQDILEANEKTSMIKLTPLKLNTLPSLGEKDILRSFQLMPGISAANENSSGLYVRGGTPDQSLVLYDGFTVYNTEHLFGFFSSFNPNAIKDVQLYKGGYESKFGGRLSSVVEITGKEGDRKRFNACVDFGMLAVNSFIESPIGEKSSVILSYRRSWQSPIYDKIYNQFSVKSNDIPTDQFNDKKGNSISTYFYDLNGKYTYRPSGNEIFSLSIYNGADNLDNSIKPRMGGGMKAMGIETTDKTYWGNTGGSARWSKNWTDKFFTNALISFSNYFSKRDRSTGGGYIDKDGDAKSIKRGVIEDNNLWDYTAKIDFEYKLAHNHKLEFGTQSILNVIDYTYSQNDTLTIIDRHTTGLTQSVYFQDKMVYFNEKLNIIPGIRYNYFSNTDKIYFEPRISSTYQLIPKLKLKLSAGRYNQFAKRVVREDIMQGSRDFWALADGKTLPVSSADHLILGFAYETKDFLFDVEGYYKSLSNLSEYSLRFKTDPESVSYEESYLRGSGISKGIDILIQKKYGNYTGWIGYTIGRTINKYKEYGNYYFYASNDVTNEFKIVNSYKWRKWDFAATWIYATGKPYTAPEGGYMITLLDGTTQDYINVTVKNGMRLPAYHRLDVSATYSFILGPDSPCTVSFSVFNLYNRQNIWYNEYEIVDNEIVKTPVKFLGITPNINLTIKFR